jgi:hypothetical protein
MIQHARPHLRIIRAPEFSYLCLPVTLFTKKLVYLIIQITNPKLTKSSCSNERIHVSLNFSQCYNSGFQSSGMWCCVDEQVVSSISKAIYSFNMMGATHPAVQSHPTWLGPKKGSKIIKVKTD